MIGRGALIKPWIFTEVKERREWDISSSERLELIRKVQCFISLVAVLTEQKYFSQCLNPFASSDSTRNMVSSESLPLPQSFTDQPRGSPVTHPNVDHYHFFVRSHFGSDTAGVNTTRRYLCEALSFQHRYVPIGLLEVLPGKLNDRPPAFRGRDELGKFVELL